MVVVSDGAPSPTRTSGSPSLLAAFSEYGWNHAATGPSVRGRHSPSWLFSTSLAATQQNGVRLVCFTIVAEREGVTLFNRRTTPREALFFASSRVQGGAERVWVYDQAWQFVSASALAEAARQQAGAFEAALHALDQALADLVSLERQPHPSNNGGATGLWTDPDAG